jgi:hypothetical protein
MTTEEPTRRTNTVPAAMPKDRRPTRRTVPATVTRAPGAMSARIPPSRAFVVRTRISVVVRISGPATVDSTTSRTSRRPRGVNEVGVEYERTVA